MVCPSCGYRLSEVDRFCRRCSQPISGRAPAPPLQFTVRRRAALWGAIFMAMGFIVMLTATNDGAVAAADQEAFRIWGGVVVLVGLGVFLFGRFRHLWHVD